jgi:sugar phosphate isomerase/epimerase
MEWSPDWKILQGKNRCAIATVAAPLVAAQIARMKSMCWRDQVARMNRNTSVGVCSWSLQPSSAADLAARVRAAGVDAVQLALDPVRMGAMPLEDVVRELAGRSLRVLSGMMAMAGEDYSTLASIRSTGGVVPDVTWPANEAAAHEDARIAAELGIRLVTFHAGFVPHDDEKARATLIHRLRTLAEIFADAHVAVALETGQEDAATLRGLLEDLVAWDVGVNFDPANMILYGMGDPVDAVALLAPFIRQVHIKDATATRVPGEWGEEVPAGAGDVRWYDFFRALDAHRVQCDFIIERERGDQRIEDVRAAVAMLKQENVA